MKKYFFLAGNGELGLVLRTKPAEHRVFAYFASKCVCVHSAGHTHTNVRCVLVLTLSTTHTSNCVCKKCVNAGI